MGLRVWGQGLTKVRILTEHGGLLPVLPLAVHLIFFLTDKEGGPFRVSFTLCVLLWNPSFMLKSYGGWVVVVVVVGGLQDFSVSPSPLGPNWVFDLGWTGLGLGLWGFWDKVLGTGLDNIKYMYN